EASRLLAERQVDGLVYATMGRLRVPRPEIPPRIPLVLLNCELDEDSGAAPPAFLPDDAGGARRAARRPAETGHPPIALVSGGGRSVADEDRFAVFLDELAAWSLTPQIVPAGWQLDVGYRASSHLLAGPEPPTGLFCI